MKSIKIHVLQHVAFEPPAAIANWAESKGHPMTFTHLYKDESFPELNSFDMLVIMGGPMSFDDDDTIPWLTAEKVFIHQAIEAGKVVFGTCLGAQLMAIACGAEGRHGTEQEVGWFPVKMFNQELIFPNIPKEFTVFHWHGDTYSMPYDSVHIAGTDAFFNQGFIYQGKAIGLQFHLEVTPDSVKDLVNEVGHLIPNDPYTQTTEAILAETSYFETNQKYLFEILDYLESQV